MSKRLACATLVALSTALFGEELTEEQDLRARTATVIVSNIFGGTGAGVLVHVEKGTGCILTASDLIGSAFSDNVVLRPGLPTEKRVAAKVVTFCSSGPVTCLQVEGIEDLPEPLTLRDKTAARERDPVRVLGFSLRDVMSAQGSCPEVQPTPGTVTGLRKGEDGTVEFLLFDAGLDPGAIGGPVLDDEGQVMGLALGTLDGKRAAVAASAEVIAKHLAGKVNYLNRLAGKEVTSSAVTVVLRGSMHDPLNRVKEVSVHWIRKDQIDKTREPDRGKLARLHPSTREDRAVRSRTDLSVEFRVTRGHKDPYRLEVFWQLRYVRTDGSEFWTLPELEVIEFPPPDEPLGKIDLASLKALPPPSELRVVAARMLDSVIVDPFVSPDGKSLYVLDLSDGKVVRLSTRDLSPEAELVLPEGAVSMAMTEDGARLCVAVQDPGANRDTASDGAIEVIDARTLKLLGEARVPAAPGAMATLDAKSVLVVTRRGDLIAVDLETRKARDLSPERAAWDFIVVSPDRSCAYAAGMGSLSSFPLGAATREDAREVRARHDGGVAPGGPMLCSPDGRFLVARSGHVLRLSRNRKKELEEAHKIPQAMSLAADPACASFFLSSVDGQIEQYSFRTFEREGGWAVGGVCSPLAFDAARARLYAVRVAPSESRRLIYPEDRLQIGELVAFDVGRK